jgi:OOP family OmpA-OmpF porin
MRGARWWWVLGWAAGCARPDAVRADWIAAETAIASAQALHAATCNPTALARAEAQLRFARLEADQGDLPRAAEHARLARSTAEQSVRDAEACGRADRDADGVIDRSDACPDEAEDRDQFRDDDGCPDPDLLGDDDGDGVANLDDGLNTDDDHDGIGALLDVCPSRAEDRDGWDDDDGCPDPDDDGDGVADLDDRCPREPGDRLRSGCPAVDADRDGVADGHDRCPQTPETTNQYLDGDGCPDTPPTHAFLTNTRIEALEPIPFDFATATLRPEALPVLDDIAKILLDAPALRVVVEGHTDTDGEPGFLFALSRERAESVRAYLESRGIAPDRLAVIGFGGNRPVASNATPEGRAQNRRTAFALLPGGAR